MKKILMGLRISILGDSYQKFSSRGVGGRAPALLAPAKETQPSGLKPRNFGDFKNLFVITLLDTLEECFNLKG
jgi:hypothetical protein